MEINEPYPTELKLSINRFLDRIEQVLLNSGTSRAERTSICAEVETQIHAMIERKLEAGAELNLELVNGIIESMDPPESYAPSAEPVLQAEPVLMAEPISTASKPSPKQKFLGYVRKILNRPKRTTPALDWVAISGLVATCFGTLLIATGLAGRAEGPTVFGFLMLFVGVAASGISFWRIRHSNGLLTGQRVASAGMLMLPFFIVDAVLSLILFASPFGRFLGAVVMATALLYANYRVFQAAMQWLALYTAKVPEGEFAKTEINRDPEIEPGQLTSVPI